MKSLLLVLVKSHNLVFSVEDIMVRYNNKTELNPTLIFSDFKILKQENKLNEK